MNIRFIIHKNYLYWEKALYTYYQDALIIPFRQKMYFKADILAEAINYVCKTSINNLIISKTVSKFMHNI